MYSDTRVVWRERQRQHFYGCLWTASGAPDANYVQSLWDDIASLRIQTQFNLYGRAAFFVPARSTGVFCLAMPALRRTWPIFATGHNTPFAHSI
ncbi:hypothetical protein [Microbacterium sp. YY-01]|uniref:hypothetical protein n=1 Tax=Microbacterium sp. YY-01 TaxID=3421634 RepID=UPI003D1631AC